MNDLDTNNHEQIVELAAGYALEALEPEEAQILEAHLPTCPECREAVAEMRGVVSLLPYTVPLIEPPADLKARLLERIRGDQGEGSAPGVAPARAVERPTPAKSRMFSWLSGKAFPLAFATAALLLLIGMGAMLLQQRNQISELQAQVEQRETLEALLASPDTVAQPIRQDEVQAKMYMSPDSNVAYLAVNGLPRLPQDRDYQVWLLQGEQPVSVGVFHPNGAGKWLLHSDEPMRSYSWVGITQEPRGGSSKPTTDPVLGAEL